jgi:hypothetical protein
MVGYIASIDGTQLVSPDLLSAGEEVPAFGCDGTVLAWTSGKLLDSTVAVILL